MNQNLQPPKKLIMDIYSSFIHDGLNLKATKIFSVGELINSILMMDYYLILKEISYEFVKRHSGHFENVYFPVKYINLKRLYTL